MFGSIGVPELLFILVLALLVFGPRRLPEIGRTLGKALGEFRRSTNALKRSIETEIAIDENPLLKPARTPRRLAPGEDWSAPEPDAPPAAPAVPEPSKVDAPAVQGSPSGSAAFPES